MITDFKIFPETAEFWFSNYCTCIAKEKLYFSLSVVFIVT